MGEIASATGLLCRTNAGRAAAAQCLPGGCYRAFPRLPLERGLTIPRAVKNLQSRWRNVTTQWGREGTVQKLQLGRAELHGPTLPGLWKTGHKDAQVCLLQVVEKNPSLPPTETESARLLLSMGWCRCVGGTGNLAHGPIPPEQRRRTSCEYVRAH
jgi:hypothetical protein